MDGPALKLILSLHAQSPFEASSLLSESLGIYGYFINNKSVRVLLATGPPNATTHNLHEADETYHRFRASVSSRLSSKQRYVIYLLLGLSQISARAHTPTNHCTSPYLTGSADQPDLNERHILNTFVAINMLCWNHQVEQNAQLSTTTCAVCCS